MIELYFQPFPCLCYILWELLCFLWNVGVCLFILLGVFKDLKVDSESEEKFANCVCELRM